MGRKLVRIDQLKPDHYVTGIPREITVEEWRDLTKEERKYLKDIELYKPIYEDTSEDVHDEEPSEDEPVVGEVVMPEDSEEVTHGE